ncbi:MAG: hypothetical protein KC656_29530, partial [Myxococcales bacterium]|nr:hypothetical protein [Myxococcales bacterium]
EGSTGEPLGLVRIDVQASAGATVIGAGTGDTHSGDCSACVWDAGRDRYVLLPGAHDDAPLLTDTDGMARVYLWIDAFPGSLEPIEVDVDTEASGATFEIHGF